MSLPPDAGRGDEIRVLSGFASSPTSDRKYYMKGDTLVEYMRAYEGVGPDPSTYQVGAFMGYVIGAYDAAPDLCSGDQVTVGQLCTRSRSISRRQKRGTGQPGTW